MKSLSFDNVSFAYDGQHPIFDGLSFSIYPRVPGKGHICCLMGKSGSGKSTFFKLILKIENPVTGEIKFEPLSPTYAFLPQEPVLFEHLNILDNARYFSRIKTYRDRFDEQLFNEVASLLELNEIVYLNRKISELSGGQQQKISLLRALSIRPDVLLLDEPTNGLDSGAKIQFLQLLKQLTIKYDLMVIYITHNKTEAEVVADELLFLHKDDMSGSVNRVFQGNLADFANTPPHMELLNVFKYPAPILIRCLTINSTVFPTDEGEYYFINVEANQLMVDVDAGFPFEVLSSSNLYSTIGLKGSNQKLTIPSFILNGNKGQFLQVNGFVNVYGKDRAFFKNIQINKNKIMA